MKNSSILIACALLGLATAACGGDPDLSPQPDSSVPMPDAGPPPPPPPPPEPVDCETDEVASFFGTVTALSDRAPIEGASVCVLDHSEIPCATTNADGFYQLDCAPVGSAAISFEAAGFASGVWLWMGVAGETQELSISLARDSENTAYLQPTGMTYPDGESSLATIVLLGRVEGLTAVQRSGSGEGAFYSADQGGRIDPTATSALGENELVFFLARPVEGWSEVEFLLEPPAGVTCAQIDGAWAARDSMPNAVRMPVRPGWESVVWMRCE